MKAKKSLDTKALEAALPALTRKLRDLKNELSPEEQAVFSSIVSSAALHLQSMGAIEPTAQVQYAKPISAVASVGVRKALLNMPRKLGFAE